MNQSQWRNDRDTILPKGKKEAYCPKIYSFHKNNKKQLQSITLRSRQFTVVTIPRNKSNKYHAEL